MFRQDELEVLDLWIIDRERHVQWEQLFCPGTLAEPEDRTDTEWLNSIVNQDSIARK